MVRETMANNRIIRRLFTLLAGKPDEAPQDGREYARSNGSWVPVTGDAWDLDTRGGTITNSDDTIPYVKFKPHWDDLRVPATSTKLGGAKDPSFGQWITDGLGSQGVYTYFFGSGIEEEVFITVQMPHAWLEGSEIKPHVHWFPVANFSGTVVWGLEYLVLPPREIAAPGTTTTVASEAITAGPGLVDQHLITGFPAIDMTDNPVSTILLFRLYRDATSPSDTYGADTGFLEFDIHYLSDSIGSIGEFSKA